MKKQVLILILILGFGTFSFAQCDKNIRLISSKTIYLDSNMNVERVVEEKSVIEINNKNLTIIPGNEDHKMTGVIVSETCKWMQPFKEGKTIIRSTIANPRGEAKNVTLTIEGKEGKISLLFEMDDQPGKKIKVIADIFEGYK